MLLIMGLGIWQAGGSQAEGLIIVLGALLVLLLVSFGLYYVGAGGVLLGWWERLRAWEAGRRARFEAIEAARRREREVGIEIGLPPSKALDGAVEVMTRGGYSLESRTENTVTFARSGQINACLGCFLALLFLIPMIVYLLIVAGRTLRVTVAAYPREEGGSRVVVGGDDEGGIRVLAEWARTLPSEPEAVVAVEEPLELLAAPGPTIADKLHELSELKEAGLITQEEYEAKKAELLGRM